MKNVILIDGNNLMYRSYYATMYSGANMKANDGTPTNALFGFVNMLTKIINEENPSYILVAFDKGKTFRHDSYEDYKGGRNETPSDLKSQFPIAKEILTLMNIKYVEIDNYEADDIIGTVAKMIDDNDDFVGTIISSDRDLLQLVSKDIKMKLLKQTGFLYITNDNFYENFNFYPHNIIDIKGLQGDASDNIPGVKGVGEKTAIKLIEEYKSLEGIYANINNIKGSLKEKLITDKEKAFLSKALATICKTTPIDFTLEDLKYFKSMPEELVLKYKQLNFNSFIKNVDSKIIKVDDYIVLDDINKLILEDKISLYLELSEYNYHNATILGASIADSKHCYYVSNELFFKILPLLKEKQIITYDYKRLLVSLLKEKQEDLTVIFDEYLAYLLLETNVKDDISYVGANYNIKENKNLDSKDFIKNSVLKAKFIYEEYPLLQTKIKTTNQEDVYYNLELPLVKVLSSMENVGVKVDRSVLEEISANLKIKLDMLEQDIYNACGEVFNIASPKQLGEILFEKLLLPHGKKKTNGYSTDINILEKLKHKHIVVPMIIEHRLISKILSTYAYGLTNYIKEDNRIHTIYTQALTRTGRLSSTEPNLQNIPTKNLLGKQIKKAFVSNNGILISADYSQVELRVLAHMSNVSSLIDVFNNNQDIHKEVASKIFNVDGNLVTSEMRRKAKVINFGILYGMSNFGLSEELEVSVNEAKIFMENYYNSYKGVKDYMDSLVEETIKTSLSKTLLGRVRTITEINNPNYIIKEQGKRMALNTPIQGTAADIMKQAMINVYQRIKKENLKSKLVLQVHDELIVDTYLDEEKQITSILKEEMEHAYPLTVKLEVDVEKGDNWFDIK